jgi:uncharacterized membrane protein HdeD (DUF308 family)
MLGAFFIAIRVTAETSDQPDQQADQRAVNQTTAVSGGGGNRMFCATLGWVFSPDSLNSPLIHLFSGATMLGAFFIAAGICQRIAFFHSRNRPPAR